MLATALLGEASVCVDSFVDFRARFGVVVLLTDRGSGSDVGLRRVLFVGAV